MSDEKLRGGFEGGDGEGGGRSNNPGPSIREDKVIEWVPKINPEDPGGREGEPDGDECPRDVPDRLERDPERDLERDLERYVERNPEPLS